ncbi:MAG TPA: hypothetical protein VGB52_09210 [Actinomycetota bacterium]
MRRRSAGFLLIVAAVAAVTPGQAAEPPCALDAELCAPADADASCSAVGLWGSGMLDVAHATTLVKDTVSDERDYQNPHATEFGYRTPAMPSMVPPEAQFDVSVHLGAVESFCHSYTFEGNSMIKSCGGAKVGEAIFTINRPTSPNKVRLVVEDMTTTVCRAAEPGLLGPVFDMRAGRIVLEVGDGAFPINLEAQQGTVVPFGSPDTFLAINERFSSGAVGGCATDDVTALRLVTGDSQLVLGGASIKTCEL